MKHYFAGEVDANTFRQKQALELESVNSVLLNSVSRLADKEGTEAFLEYVLSEIARLVGASTLFLIRYDCANRLLALHLTYLNGKLRLGMSGEEFSILAAPFPVNITPAFEIMCRERRFLTPADCPIPAEEFAWPGVMEELVGRALSDIAHLALMVGDMPVGSLSLEFEDGRKFQEADQSLVQALAQQMAIALRLANAAEQERQSAVAVAQERTAKERAIELEQVNSALRSSMAKLSEQADVGAFLAETLGEIVRQMNADNGFILAVDGNTHMARLHLFHNGKTARWGMSGEEIPLLAMPFSADVTPAFEIMCRTHQPFVASRFTLPMPIEQFALPGGMEYMQQNDISDSAIITLRAGERVIGTLHLQFVGGIVLREEDEPLFTAMSQQAAIAMHLTELAEASKQTAVVREQEKAAQERAAELAKANEELKREILERQRAEQVSRGQTEAMMQALNVLAAETDLGAFLSHVMCAIATQLNTQMCALYFYDRETDLISLHMTYHYGQTLQGDEQAGNPCAGNPHRAEQDGFWATHVKTRRPVIVPDISRDPFFHQFTWLTHLGIQSLFSVPLVFGEEVIGYLVVRSKERHDYAPEEIELAQALAHQITLAVNTTQLAEVAKQAAISREQENAAQERAVELARINRALTLEVEERQRAELLAQGQLQALNHTLRTFAHEPELDQFLGYVLRALTEQLGEQSGTIWLYDPQWEATILHTELHDGQLQHFPTPALQDVARRWDREFLPHLRSRQVLIHTESDFATHAAYLPYQQYFAERGIRTILNIPLVAGENFLGIFAVRSKVLRGYTPSELELAQALAHQAVLAIQITRLAEIAKQTATVKAERAVLEERNRLAQEIHDTLAHNFTSIKFLLEAAELMGALPAAPAAIIAQAREIAGVGAKEARRSVWALRPEALERGDLLSALSAVIQQRTQETTLHVDLHVEGELFALRPEVEDNLLRVSQEALANVVKHAQAAQARVTLTFAAPGVTLHVSDAGKGFDPQIKPEGTGLGLIGMRERVVRLGGKLSIVSGSGAGTEIRAFIPHAERSEISRVSPS